MNEEIEQFNIIYTFQNAQRLDSFLKERYSIYSRTFIQKLISEGNVCVNGNTVKANLKLKINDEITLKIVKPKVLDVKPEKHDLDIVYEDQDIIVINKKKGMVVHPAAGNYSGTLVNALMEHCKNSLSDINGVIRPGIVHRIDKDTSGILVVAKNNLAHEALSLMFKTHDISRIYVALVDKVINEEKGRIEAPIGRHPVDRKKMSVNLKNGRHAITHFTVLERFKNATLIECKLETGRTHQIRVHMSYIGHPVLGDGVYGIKKNKYNLEGQCLHARLLGFIHPTTKKYIEFESEIPDYFKELIKKLKI